MLHSSPGPAIELFGGNFMPISFIAGNVAVLGLLAVNKRLSGALNVALLGLFINFVGLGLEGALDNGEYNLALNDGVKGCPTYQQVKQPSMADFDVKKYTGRWYVHARVRVRVRVGGELDVEGRVVHVRELRVVVEGVLVPVAIGGRGCNRT